MLQKTKATGPDSIPAQVSRYPKGSRIGHTQIGEKWGSIFSITSLFYSISFSFFCILYACLTLFF